MSLILGLFFLSCAVGYGLHWYNANPKGFLYPLNFIMSNTFSEEVQNFFGMLLAYMLKQESKVSTLLKLKNPTLYGGLLMLVFTIAIAFCQK